MTPWTTVPLGFYVHGIIQARILEWIAISFSRGSFWSRNWTRVSCIAGRFLYNTYNSLHSWLGHSQVFPFYLQPLFHSQPQDYGPLYCLAARPEFSRLFTPWAEVCSSVVLPVGGVVMPSSHLMFQNYKHISNYMGQLKNHFPDLKKKKSVRTAFKNKEFNS